METIIEIPDWLAEKENVSPKLKVKKVRGETEKAFMVDVVSAEDADAEIKYEIWLPKSQIKNFSGKLEMPERSRRFLQKMSSLKKSLR